MREDRQMWLKGSKEFNDWRRENDLPEFLKFAKEALPHFRDWQQEFGITDELFLLSNQTSEFFVDKGRHAFYKYYNPWHWDKTPEVLSATVESFAKTKEWADRNNQQIKGEDKFEYELYTEFLPYFDWLQSAKGIASFEVKSDYRTSAHVDDFRYNHWAGDPQHSVFAEIFGKYKVLNLGQVRIPGGLIRGKNLDFTNLDGLQITSKKVTSVTFSKIRYASCRELSLVDLDMAFLEFQRCHFSDMNIINCNIQDLHLIKIEGGIRRIYNSRLTHLKFNQCCPIGRFTDVNRADMPDFQFINQKKTKNDDKYHFHNKMRKAAQDCGYSHQAQENFYLERKHLMLFKSDPNNIPEYRSLNNPNLSHTFSRIKNNGWRIDKTLAYLWRRCLRDSKALANRKFLYAYVSTRMHTVFEGLNFLIWGFGEKPWRVVTASLFDITIFAFAYNYFHFRNFAEAFVNSVFVFTSVGYGELTSSLGMQYIVAAQALSGFVLLGLFLSAIVNKVRY